MSDAWALAVAAVANMITEIVKGQPPEFKRQAWEDWAEFLALFKVKE